MHKHTHTHTNTHTHTHTNTHTHTHTHTGFNMYVGVAHGYHGLGHKHKVSLITRDKITENHFYVLLFVINVLTVSLVKIYVCDAKIYICILTSINTHTQTCTYKSAHTQTHTHTYAYTHTHTHTHKHKHTQACTYVCIMYTYMHTSKAHMYVRMYACTKLEADFRR